MADKRDYYEVLRRRAKAPVRTRLKKHTAKWQRNIIPDLNPGDKECGGQVQRGQDEAYEVLSDQLKSGRGTTSSATQEWILPQRAAPGPTADRAALAAASISAIWAIFLRTFSAVSAVRAASAPIPTPPAEEMICGRRCTIDFMESCKGTQKEVSVSVDGNLRGMRRKRLRQGQFPASPAESAAAPARCGCSSAPPLA